MYYVKIKDGLIQEYVRKKDVESGMVQIDFNDTIDYEPIQYKGKIYTQEKFAEIEQSQEYKDEKEASNRSSFEFEAKQLENEATFIEYKNKKISLDEILFKSTIYNSLTDTVVYLKAEDGSLLKVSRTIFLLIVAKAKANLKDVEEALYNASYDKSKSLEDNINSIKGIFNAIDKIFNG